MRHGHSPSQVAGRTPFTACRTPRIAGRALLGAAVFAWLAAMPLRADDATPQRVEAKSATLLAVGVVHGDRMTIHLSRLSDNAPVRDAVLAVMLRGVVHPTVAQPDGSYTLQTQDLELPGAAAVEFQVVQGPARDVLEGDLAAAAAAKPEERSMARQMWWWALNFAVCIGFLMLWSRRRKAREEQEASED